MALTGEIPTRRGLTIDGSGNLFGTADFDTVKDDGVVYEITRGSTIITVLARFNGTNGAGPQGSVVFDSSGNLFGTTNDGGAFSDGTIFEIANGATAASRLWPVSMEQMDKAPYREW